MMHKPEDPIAEKTKPECSHTRACDPSLVWGRDRSITGASFGPQTSSRFSGRLLSQGNKMAFHILLWPPEIQFSW